MSATSRVGTAVAAGYVLGRFRKLRLAVLAGTALANKQVRDAGLDLIRQGSGSGASGKDGLGRKLIDEARSAATAVAASRMDSISDRLHERTVAMGGGSEGSEESGDAEDQDEYDDQADEGQDEYDGSDGDAEDEYDDDSDEEYDEDDEPEDEDSGEQHRSSRRRRAAAPAGGR